jgi:hypothetical protein
MNYYTISVYGKADGEPAYGTKNFQIYVKELEIFNRKNRKKITNKRQIAKILGVKPERTGIIIYSVGQIIWTGTGNGRTLLMGTKSPYYIWV